MATYRGVTSYNQQRQYAEWNAARKVRNDYAAKVADREREIVAAPVIAAAIASLSPVETTKAELVTLSDRVTDQQVSARQDWMRAACDYATNYAGTFSYMVDMHSAMVRYHGLTIPQMRGTLNCLRAEGQREVTEMARRAAAVAETISIVEMPATGTVADGFYTVSFEDGSHVTLRINSVSAKQSRSGKAARYASYLNGPSNTSDYQRFAFLNTTGYKAFRMGNYARQIAALETLLSASDESQTAYGKAYARESGNCYVCGRLLTDPDSIAAGIGPICAAR